MFCIARVSGVRLQILDKCSKECDACKDMKNNYKSDTWWDLLFDLPHVLGASRSRTSRAADGPVFNQTAQTNGTSISLQYRRMTEKRANQRAKGN